MEEELSKEIEQTQEQLSRSMTTEADLTYPRENYQRRRTNTALDNPQA